MVLGPESNIYGGLNSGMGGGEQASATVLIQYPPGAAPQRLEDAAAVMEKFGEIARIDMSLAGTSGEVLATFFDVRHAQKLMVHFSGMAAPSPASPEDNRTVFLSPSDFARISSTSGFGEVSSVSTVGNEMVLEFFDLRAAQRATQSLQMLRSSECYTSAAEGMTPSDGSQEEGVGPGEPADFMRQADLFGNQSGPMSSDLVADFTQQVLIAQSAMQAQAAAYFNMADFNMAGPFNFNLAMNSNLGLPEGLQESRPRNGKQANANKPVQERVSSKELQKFEIDPARIESGADHRTTVMLRNMPKSCSREDFLQTLGRCGLRDRITFLYMPFDKRRSLHCGFAFVNFVAAEDILLLIRQMQGKVFSELSRSAPMPLAVSYARLQGHDQLVSHFSLSAVMYDEDARKRPLFVPTSGLTAKAEDVDPKSMMSPAYVTPGTSPTNLVSGSTIMDDLNLSDKTTDTNSGSDTNSNSNSSTNREKGAGPSAGA